MADAIKIAAVRASVKVMVYGCEGVDHGGEIREMLIKLRRKACDDKPWLCIGVPWNLPTKGKWACDAKVIQGR